MPEIVYHPKDRVRVRATGAEKVIEADLSVMCPPRDVTTDGAMSDGRALAPLTPVSGA